MEEKGLDVYTVQETWLDGNMDWDINGYHVFCHGLPEQTCSRGQSGVAIILSPSLYKDYQDSGSPPPVYSPADNAVTKGRFIGRWFQIRVSNNPRGAFR